MRKVMYRVKGADGKEFHTASYFEATADGCKLEETYLVPIDERTDEEKK